MEKHDLLHEFPEHKERIHQLKVENHHFRKLFDDYHELQNRIYNINAGAEIVIDEYAHELKAKLLHLKDTLYDYLNR
jgi:uncharacterized protein